MPSAAASTSSFSGGRETEDAEAVAAVATAAPAAVMAAFMVSAAASSHTTTSMPPSEMSRSRQWARSSIADSGAHCSGAHGRPASTAASTATDSAALTPVKHSPTARSGEWPPPITTASLRRLSDRLSDASAMAA